MTNSTLVTILINNYNYDIFLRKAIDSALNQTYDNIEVIVVDDGSTDNSHNIIASYGEKIIPVLKSNGGQASAFNAGFANSRGDIVCFLDADDLFVPTKIAKIVQAFNHNQKAGCCFHPLKFVDQDLKSLNIKQKYTGKSGIYDIRNAIKNGKLNGRLPFHGVVTSGLCYRRSVLSKLLPMPETLRITSDDYLKYAAFALTPVYALLEELAWQTIHDNNAYTFRQDKQELRAKINIMTAYLLKQKIPLMSKFTNNIFALGLSLYQQTPQKDPDVSYLIADYFSSLNPIEKIAIKSRSFYYYLKK